MQYTATLDGRCLKEGSLQEVRGAVMLAVTDLLADDPDGVSKGALTANMAFNDGSLEETVRTQGQWLTDVGGKTLSVTGRTP